MSDLQNSEYLNRARNLLTDRYNKLKSAEYTQWMSNHKTAWAQPHTVVPFPPFVVCGALAPFKASVSPPTEDQIVAKALELYNTANPVVALDAKSVSLPEKKVAAVPTNVSIDSTIDTTELTDAQSESEVQATITESDTVEELLPEGEIPAIEPSYVDDIYKIFQTEVQVDLKDAVPPEIEAAPGIVAEPQSVEILENKKPAGGLLPSVLQRLQDMRSMWATEN